MGDDQSARGEDRAARLGAALRANLRRRKAQARGRDDLSGRDPNRTDTPLGEAGVRESSANSPQDGPNRTPEAKP